MAIKKVYRKRAVRRVAKKAAAPKKFGYVKSRGNLLKDVSMLKKMVRRTKPEVKYITNPVSSDLVGQVDGNGGGASGFFITNTCGAGVGVGDRNGLETKLIGINMRMQFSQQSAATGPIRLIMDVFKFTDRSSTIANLVNLIYQTDSISGVVDYNSTRNPSYVREYKRIYSRKISLKPDNFSGQLMLADLKGLIKQNQKLRYAATTTADAVNYGYAVIIRSDTGNKSTTTASTNTNIANTAVSTGVLYRIFYKTYYTDV